jgi:hypothetical protein
LGFQLPQLPPVAVGPVFEGTPRRAVSLPLRQSANCGLILSLCKRLSLLAPKGQFKKTYPHAKTQLCSGQMPLALEMLMPAQDCILFHISGMMGPETKQHPQGRADSRQQPCYEIGRLAQSRALDPVKTTGVFPFLPQDGEI